MRARGEQRRRERERDAGAPHGPTPRLARRAPLCRASLPTAGWSGYYLILIYKKLNKKINYAGNQKKGNEKKQYCQIKI